jgi:D-threo-aldose 1-dehydrogenase
MGTSVALADGDVSDFIAKRPLGSTGLSLTELGLGGAPIGNLYQEVPDTVAQATVEQALAANINYFDTAPLYGHGLSEIRLGGILQGRGGLIVSTKVGRLLIPDVTVADSRERHGFCSASPYAPIFDYRYDAILRSHRESLERLAIPRIDILYIHDIGRRTHGAHHETMWRQLIDEGGLEALEHLRASGTIGAYGAGVNEVEVCRDLLSVARPDVFLLAGRYTLLEQQPLEDLFPACAEAGVSIVVGGPYNSGILATGVRSGQPAHFDYGVAPQAIVARVAAMEAIADRYAIPLAAAALQFPLAHPLVASVIPGLDTPARVARTMQLYGTRIPSDFWSDLKAAGLLHEAAPVPEGSR